MGGALLFATLLLLLVVGCQKRRDGDSTPASNPCTACHGSAAREGSMLEQAAPPVDLLGRTETRFRGVGAHQLHLAGGATHGKVACGECHVVPTRVDSPGHADGVHPASVVFGELARTGSSSPTYDTTSLTCAGSYCHGGAVPVWNEPRSSSAACGSCHGLPPAPPHPQAQDCEQCHGEVIAKDRSFLRPDLHVNGKVELQMSCNSCHGSAGSNAPPVDLAGNSERGSVGVGAHQAHLGGGAFSRALECGECHQVPANVSDPGHLDDTPGAEVVFSGVALAEGSQAVWDRSSSTCASAWCHGPRQPASTVSPKWTYENGPLGCTSCHGNPPAPPHPQMSDCAFCHGAVVAADNATIKNRDLHVNGQVDVQLPTACNACHGSSGSPAPPKDLAGNTSFTERGVGAHQAHLSVATWRRTLECSDCHVVPVNVLDTGHLDTALPAEVVFSALVSTGEGGPPGFNGVTCDNTWCHGGRSYEGNAFGGSLPLPPWVGKPSLNCGSCHGLPPDSGAHLLFPNEPCGTCHAWMGGTTGWDFVNPALHMNGKVD